MRTFTLFAALLLLGTTTIASAQVHRCTDAGGRVTFSDTACPNSAKKADRVMGEGATQQRWEPEGFRAQQNLDSINRARALQQESVDVVTRQSQGEAGAGAIGQGAAPAPQRPDPAYSDSCETQSSRKGCIGGARSTNPNWSAGRGYHGGGGPADQRAANAQRARNAAPPGQMVNCDPAGCWGAQNGVRYNFVAGGNLQGTNGSFCARGAGGTFSCN
jgi:hypothetical protein